MSGSPNTTDLLVEPNRPLKDVLFENYMVDTAEWLLGGDDSPYLLAQSGNSNWECSLSISYLLFMHEQLDGGSDEHAELVAQIEEKIPQTAVWMKKQAREFEIGGRDVAHWEEVTWDTAVVIRALLSTLNRFPDTFSSKQRAEIEELVETGIRWLAFRFNDWEENVIYAFGPADVAQILITAIETYEQDSQYLERGIEPYYSSPTDFMEDIVQYLVTYGEEVELDRNESDLTASYWGDPFQSAEVIDALAMYLSEVEVGCLTTTKDALLSDCEQSVSSCIIYLESQQDNGKWGSHSDTCRTLFSYLRATQHLENIDPEHHIALKAVRWISDEKQTFSDGSYLHTMYLTVFYALALQETYKNWPLAEKSAMAVYDDAMWSAPVRSTPERSERLKLELKSKKLQKERERLLRRFSVVASVAVFFLVTVASMVVPLAIGWLTIEGSVSLSTLITYFGAVTVVLAIAIGGGVYNVVDEM